MIRAGNYRLEGPEDRRPILAKPYEHRTVTVVIGWAYVGPGGAIRVEVDRRFLT